jgi:hypothetical protein
MFEDRISEVAVIALGTVSTALIERHRKKIIYLLFARLLLLLIF